MFEELKIIMKNEGESKFGRLVRHLYGKYNRVKAEYEECKANGYYEISHEKAAEMASLYETLELIVTTENRIYTLDI